MEDYTEKYVEYLRNFLKVEAKVSAVFDSSNGPTSLVLEPLFKSQTDIKAQIINGKIDGAFPAHGPNPLGKKAMEDLTQAVKKSKADVGIIFDGDGDRVSFTDETGVPIPPPETFLFLSRHFKPTYVIDSMTGQLQLQWMQKDIDVIESKTGRYFMKKVMGERGLEFGGEYSGHYYFKNFFYSSSGIFSAIVMLNEVSALKSAGGTLSSWLESLPDIARAILTLNVEDIDTAIAKLETHFTSSSYKLSHIDGMTLIGENSWANIRKSNTEPVLRISLAAQTPSALEKLKQSVLEITLS